MLIDFHTHIFPDKIAEKTIAALARAGGTKPYASGSYAGLKEAMEKANAMLAVALPVLTKPEQFDSVFRFASEINERERNAKNRILSFAGIHPACEDIKGKMKAVKEAGFKGVKIHPDYQGAYIDDEGYLRILRAASDNDLIVVTHAGLDGAFLDAPIKCTPERVLRVLDKVNGVKLVLAHNGGNELFDDVFKLIAGKNVYIDTAYNLAATGKEKFLRLLEKHGEDKILFATDSPWRDMKTEADVLRSFGLKQSVQDKIFRENALKLLNESAAK